MPSRAEPGTVSGMNLMLILVLVNHLRHRLMPAILFLISCTASLCSSAQSYSSSQAQATPPPSAPPATTPYLRESFYPYAGVFCGLGATTSSVATKPTTGCGVGFTLVPLPIYTEVGIMGPQANRSYLSGYVSVDTSIPLAKTTSTYLPVVLFGYSRLFETGHALDYGVALVLPKPASLKNVYGDNLRVELRDYWTFANPNQHNVMLRLGLISFEAD